MGTSKIEWTEKTWNPITGCTPISEGCQNCYAERMAKRLAGRYGYPADIPFMPGNFHFDKLDEPLRWKKPSRIFVCSMGDLFHEAVPFPLITDVFDVMCSWRWPNKAAEREGDESLLEDPGHTFIVLTKRPGRVLEWRNWLGEQWPGDTPVQVNLDTEGHFGKHIWLGVTAENQQRADERVPILLQIPAAVRFVSVEPMLGPVDLWRYMFLTGASTAGPFYDYAGKRVGGPGGIGGQAITEIPSKYINWVICGGETGPRARAMNPEWVRSLRNQCINAGVPFFFKQWGEWIPTHLDWGAYTEQEFMPKSEIIKNHKTIYVSEGVPMSRVGKKKVGQLLDGREWNEYPGGAM